MAEPDPRVYTLEDLFRQEIVARSGDSAGLAVNGACGSSSSAI